MLNLDFQKDRFSRDVSEMPILVELSLLKHETRIPVEKDRHLHGLMDETLFLEVGQIYCPVMVDGKSQAILGKDLIVIRGPALHLEMCNWRKESCHHLTPHCLHFLIAFALVKRLPKICHLSSAEVILMGIGTTSCGTRIIDPKDTLLLQTIHVRNQMNSTDLWRGMT
jgi:hypothetical protein